MSTNCLVTRLLACGQHGSYGALVVALQGSGRSSTEGLKQQFEG